MSELSIKTVIYIDGVERDLQGQFLPGTEGGMFSKDFVFIDNEGEPIQITYQTQWRIRSLNLPPQLSQRLSKTVADDV